MNYWSWARQLGSKTIGDNVEELTLILKKKGNAMSVYEWENLMLSRDDSCGDIPREMSVL